MTLTDNGSNMLKAFHAHIMEGDEGDKEDEEGNEDGGDNGEEDEQNDFDTQEIDHEVAFTTKLILKKEVALHTHYSW